MLVIDGLCESPLTLSWDELEALARSGALVEHTERLSPKVSGEGVRLDEILSRARPLPTATHVVVHGGGDYRACLSLAAEARDAVIAHRSSGAPLAASSGGPLRLLCPTSGNACLSVKQVARLELTDGPTVDTVPRPTTPLRSR
jgi:DMSO/TMAO reductase YedYZ molybdopterin-dependent catalytic subunit